MAAAINPLQVGERYHVEACTLSHDMNSAGHKPQAQPRNMLFQKVACCSEKTLNIPNTHHVEVSTSRLSPQMSESMPAFKDTHD